MGSRIAKIVLLGAFLSAVPHSIATAATMSRVRHAVDGDRVRIVIDLSGPAGYEVFPVSNPERIAVNLRGTRASRSVASIPLNNTLARRVRINRLSWGTQVVIDLKRKCEWSDFHLASVDGMPHRVVLDITPSGPASLAGGTSTRVKAQAEAVRDFVVAVDAGHGGKDPGTTSRKNGIIEKNEALVIARQVARTIDRIDGYKAVMIRDRDVFISLPDRTRIAKEKGADIFVSIHLNSAPKSSARGSEVYFLSPSGAQRTAKKALRNEQKAARELGLDGASSSDIVHMLVDVNQQQMMQRSALLAEEILKSLDRKGLPPTRAIKQQAFAVLKSISMPSVMVESGFVTNSRDAKILRSQSGKEQFANAVADGVVNFLRQYPPAVDATGRVLVHKVKKGDTLWTISRRYRTSVASIRKTNRLGQSEIIHVGQKLLIREGYAAN